VEAGGAALNTTELVRELERTRDEVLKYFALPEADLAKRYGPGKWNVRYILHHLAESEVVFRERLRRAISEPGGIAWFYNQDAWAKAFDYSSYPLALSRDAFAAIRATNIEDAKRHYEQNGALEFIHSKSGLRTLTMEFDKVANHSEHHLSQIRQALK
jgi:hypothetical protein